MGKPSPDVKMIDLIATAAAAAATGGDSAPARAPAPRTYYVDWLRAALTLVVLLHHCVCEYLKQAPWVTKKGTDDPTLWLMGQQMFVNGNQAYFMTLFFFLAGIYVPGSYRRKGAARFMADRTLRLMLPCVVYSLLAQPLMAWWQDLARRGQGDLAASFQRWFAPGWPTTYVLPTGPPWFLWMLWCFNAAYVIIRLVQDAPCPLRRALAARLPPCPLHRAFLAAVGREPSNGTEYGTKQALAGGALLAGVLFVLQYATRMMDTFAFGLRPLTFVSRGPFVAFMPDFLAVYMLAFALGTASGPAGWDVLARLPSGWGGWLLTAGGAWWVLFGWLLNVTLHPMMVLQRGQQAFILTWLLRTFVEQSFAVVWSAGLLVVFRDALNARPGWLGRQIIGAAYGAYIVHPLVIAVFARALMGFYFPSYMVNAVAISVPVVVVSWLVAAGLRAIPGAHHVL